ncbi:MAG: isoprenylcysteine carboxylmethyltransferase family protein [Gammaproteobacteria bacterium]
MMRTFLPPAWLFAAILLMAVLHLLLPLSTIVPFPWNLAGLAPLAAVIILNLLADAALKRGNTTVKPFEESATLVTTGVYGLSRHPMYLGMLLILLGLAIFAGSLAPFAIVVLFGIFMERLFIRNEERMLARQFGNAWQAYRGKVNKWV